MVFKIQKSRHSNRTVTPNGTFTQNALIEESLHSSAIIKS